MERCTRCIMPSCFPGVELDEHGVCNYCLKYEEKVERGEESRRKFEKRFAELLETVPRDGNYDCLVAYSGGKDSSYTLISMKQRFHLKVLAFTFDNGFLPETTLRNIMKVVEGVGVDYILVKPDFSLMKKIFVAAATRNLYPQKTVERASTICTSCIAFVKFASLRTAIEQSIPLMTFGWSPGQVSGSSPIFKMNPMIIRSMQRVLYKPLRGVAGDAIKPYFLEEKHFEDPERFPYSISPLSFIEYDEDKVLKEISAYGWRRPEEVDPNSTNCLINSFANQLHFQQYGYNPYVFELAKMVREGYLKRENALERVEYPGDRTTTEMVRKRLELPPIGC